MPPEVPPDPVSPRGASEPLHLTHDVALLDLDGVVYRGPSAVPHAVATLTRARAEGMRTAFVTNNAARTPEQVAAHLSSLGVPAAADEVVTSAQAAAHVLADLLPPGSAVLVVGAEGLAAALRERGLLPVASADDEPRAVVQGYGPEVGWRQLAEGAYALARGVPWVASNADRTIPTSRGLAPGNGALVAALEVATGRTPQVTGKPAPPMHREAVERSRARRPVVVGDRLDTDVAGARAAGVPSLLVLTGVATPADAVLAPPAQRPEFVSADLRGLVDPHPEVTVPVPGRARCRGWSARVDAAGLHLEATGPDPDARPVDPVDPVDAVRAACGAAWSAPARTRELLEAVDVSRALSAVAPALER